MWLIGVEVKQETSAPPPKKILDPPLAVKFFLTPTLRQAKLRFLIRLWIILYNNETVCHEKQVRRH